jgi:sulfite reductase (ferredoxin)
MAEIGFVGSAPNTYQVWLGGSPDQTRLAQAYVDKMPLDQLENFFEPLLTFYSQKRRTKESFGEFCHRVGFDALREFSVTYGDEKSGRRSRKNQRRVSLSDDMYAQLKAKAAQEKRPMNQIVQEALLTYFQHQS